MSELNFCPECNNILYAHADNRRQQLKFSCRHCDFSRWADPSNADDNCINRTLYNLESKENLFVSPLVIKDPTLGRTNQWHCVKCGWQKAVFFQLPERVSDDAMMLVFVCCNTGCGYWTKQAYDEPQTPLGNSSRLAGPSKIARSFSQTQDHSRLFDEDADE
ncbi:bifunctional DNA-directed RNA polymerase M [Babesia duncani]|uniref:Bifunctional DNA-directed RNA polymerase M n=1 Tax=Babesia duncani TaxID=323732 RepID=A0AAD9UN39_9APIC|nr:bifunctional DNA-directed RNA polymerase M [Babesia duncani]